MCKVSIIIPCYNSFRYMERCLSSLEQQTFQDCEVIFVDDCSTDDTYECLQKICSKNSRYHLLKCSKNMGPGAARNLGIKKACGEYLCFMDSDDWFEYTFLEKMLENADECQADLVMCDGYQVFANGKRKINGYTSRIDGSLEKKEYLVHSKSSLGRLCIKKDLFNKLSIPQLYNGEDIAIVPLLIVYSKNISVVREPLYNYFVRGSSVSNTKSKRISGSLVHAFHILNDRIGEEYKEETEFLGIKTVLYGATLNAFKAGCSRQDVVRIINQFETEHPNWNQNTYIKLLGSKSKCYLWLIRKKCIFLSWLYSLLHNILIKLISF